LQGCAATKHRRENLGTVGDDLLVVGEGEGEMR
jgi:hypothetical protein